MLPHNTDAQAEFENGWSVVKVPFWKRFLEHGSPFRHPPFWLSLLTK